VQTRHSLSLIVQGPPADRLRRAPSATALPQTVRASCRHTSFGKRPSWRRTRWTRCVQGWLT